MEKNENEYDNYTREQLIDELRHFRKQNEEMRPPLDQVHPDLKKRRRNSSLPASNSLSSPSLAPPPQNSENVTKSMVSTRRSSLLSLEDHQRYAKTVLDHMFQFVCLAKPNGEMLLANSASLTGAGITASDIKNVPFENTPWWSDDQREKIRESLAEASRGQFIRFETQLYGGNDGKDLIWVDFSISPVVEHEKIIYLLIEARDISAKRDAERQIQEKNEELKRLCQKIVAIDEMKTRFFANVSHELRTPLTLILAPIEKMISQTRKTFPSIATNLQVVRRNSQTLLKHINDLLDVSRLEANEMNINFSQVDLSQLCRIICSNFDCLIKERNIHFTFEEESPKYSSSSNSSSPPMTSSPNLTSQFSKEFVTWVDQEKVERVIFNLLSNAFKFTSAGGHVTVSVSKFNETIEKNTGEEPQTRTYASILVSDSGVGIKKDDRKVVFERFARVEGTGSRAFGGSGLGLAICKDFITLHGGKISVSESKWGGAQFQVLIPFLSQSPVENSVKIEKIEEDKGTSLKELVLAELTEVMPSKEVEEKKEKEALDLMQICDDSEVSPPLHSSPSNSPTLVSSPNSLSKTTSIISPGASFKLNSSGTNRPTIITNNSNSPLKSFSRSPGSSPKANDSPPSPFASPASNPVINPKDKRKLRALVVEDHKDMRDFVCDVLSEDFEVSCASNGMEGFVMAIKDVPDLIVSDIMMPKLSGEEMVAKLRTQRNLDDTPIVFLTAKAEDSVRIHALQGGAQEFLNKPFSAEELRVRCGNLVSNFGARRLLQEHLKSQKANLVELTNEILESKKNIQKSLQQEEKAHAEAERYSRIKDEFLMTVGHELRTPLTGIMGWTELIHAELTSGGSLDATELASDFQNIINCCNAQRRIIDDLLDISNIVAGKLELNSIPFDIQEVLNDSMSSVRLAATARQIDLRGDWEGLAGHGVVSLLGDRARIQQVIWNLLSNAIKFTEPEGSVILTATLSSFSQENRESALEKSPRKAVKIVVKDTGKGLGKEDFHRLFKRFGQLDSTSTRAYNGLGLGLAICRHIVEGHGGSLWAESEGLGKGSSFCFLLPWVPPLKM